MNNLDKNIFIKLVLNEMLELKDETLTVAEKKTLKEAICLNVFPTTDEPELKSEYATIREQATLTFIKDYIREQGYSPTFEEIARQLNISKSAAYDRVQQLKEKGFVKNEAGAARSIVIIDKE